VSTIPFRLQPCSNPTEGSLDALTFGDPSLYEKLLTLNRVEILAGNPLVRAGTIWFRVDQNLCFVEAVAIRDGMYPLVYKVLPEMMAAQLGFSYVGRYFNMSYGYATRSLVWDDKTIQENGAKSFSSVYPGMVPIVKLTAVIGGSTRTPILVRDCLDSTAAAADALLLTDTVTAGKLADVARLEIVTGSEGTRAGTIWYFRNGNYCFVIAAAFRPEAPAEVARLAPLLVAQRFGYSYVGNYSAIPADLKDKALCWDRYTGTPIPELSPLSERLYGVQDFVLTFADSPPGNPYPDPDPYPPEVCESTSDHWGQTGWNYDGCHWSETTSPGSDYNWTENPDGLGGGWNYNPPNNCEDPNDGSKAGQPGWTYDGCHWNYLPPEPCPSQGTDLGYILNELPETNGSPYTLGYQHQPAIADGNCGAVAGAGSTTWLPYGTQVGSDSTNNYFSSGNGEYYSEAVNQCEDPNAHDNGIGGWSYDGCHWNQDPIYNPETHRHQSGWNWDGSSWSENPYPQNGFSYDWVGNMDSLGGYWNQTS